MLAAALIAAPAGAQQLDAGGLVETQREALRTALRIACPPPEEEGEIVVCGTREERDRRHRLPPSPGAYPAAADRAGGEQRAALAIDSGRCTAVGRDQQCNRGLDMIGIGFAIARAVAQAIANRD